MSDKVYNVIWIDDLYKKFIDFIISSKRKGVVITPFEFGYDGIQELKSNSAKYDAVILDIKCLYKSHDEADSSTNFYKIEKELSDINPRYGSLPLFVYSAQPDYISNTEFDNYLEGKDLKLYQKGEDDDKLLADIKKAADERFGTYIRHKYLKFNRELPSDIIKEMTSILSYIENAITDEPDIFPKMRFVINWLMDELNDYGLLAVKHNGANISACSVYLGKKELEEYVPIHIQRSLHSCVEICNNGSHRIQIFNAVQNNEAPFLIRSTVFELLNILNWYCSLPQDEAYIKKMKAFIATVPPDDKIEGVLEKDERDNYHCGKCLVGYKLMSEAGIKVGDWIRVTSTGENTKSRPEVIQKYPRFAYSIEKQ